MQRSLSTFHLQTFGKKTAQKPRFPFWKLLSGATTFFERLFFPRLCVSCTARFALKGACFCAQCRVRVVVQDMYRQQENEFTERFWGRIPLHTGAALFKFAKKCPVQRALHRFKYKNHPQTGRLLGREMGLKLAASPHYQNIDVVVCVPLHPLKEKKRGYNQSAIFGESIAEALGVPFVKNALCRRTYSPSQTTQRQLAGRYDNVKDVFELDKIQKVKNKHVLLVDDVLTSGATLEHCAQKILQIPGTRISMATIAIA